MFPSLFMMVSVKAPAVHAHCLSMSELKSSTSSRSKESPDPLLIWHRSHCQGVKLTMNSAADFLFNQHDSLLNTFLPLFEGIVLQMCYISRFTLLRVLAYNKQRGPYRTLSLSRQLASLRCVCNWLELVMVETQQSAVDTAQVAGHTGAAQQTHRR